MKSYSETILLIFVSEITKSLRFLLFLAGYNKHLRQKCHRNKIFTVT